MTILDSDFEPHAEWLPTDGETFNYVDAPNQSLTIPLPVFGTTQTFHANQYSVAENFSTYMMFKPYAGTNYGSSTWVPLKYMNWAWNADVAYSPKYKVFDFVPGPVKTSRSFVTAGTSEPDYFWLGQLIPWKP